MNQSLTLQDIAQLTHVTRQAVTNWRRRATVRGGKRFPFPQPIEPVGEVEQFDRDEILQWLRATRRGLNAEFGIDAPALVVPDGDGATLTDAVTLLTLRAATGDDLSQMSAAERTALAQQIDPGDQFLLAEVQSLGGQDRLVAYVDALMDASYGPTDALNRLYTTRLARGKGDHGLSGELVELLTELAATCRQHVGPGDVSIELRIDRRARSIAQGFANVRPSGNSPRAREMLRHLVIDGIDIATAPSPIVHVISGIGLEDRAILDLADRAALDVGANDIALVLGTASALCDPLRGDMASMRSDTLEMGRVVAALRLPRGMRLAAHRQSLGLWILQGGAERKRLVVADLGGEPIDLGDLASDVAGALDQASSRSYRYGRLILRKEAAQGRAAVVATGIRAVRLAGADSSTHNDRVTAATFITREPLGGFDVFVAPKPPGTATTPRSLGEMVEAHRIELLSGCRVNVEDDEPSGAIRVLSADPALRELRLDALVAAERYRHAKRTKPGDVVFVDRPRPSAIVDDVGGSLVRTPNRILRLPAGAGIGPRALAEVIDHLPDDVGEWGTWSIPNLASDQIDDVERTLADAEVYVAELRRRETAMYQLTTSLIQGLAVDGLLITSSITTNEKAG